MPSPAEIIRSCLIDLGLVQLPPDMLNVTPLPNSDTVTCFVSSLPNNYDKAVCLYDSEGYNEGKEMRGGRRHLHPGVRVLIRHLEYDAGNSLAESIASALDQLDLVTTTVPEDNQPHYVQAFSRTTGIISLGEEVNQKRQRWTINGRVSFQSQEGFLG